MKARILFEAKGRAAFSRGLPMSAGRVYRDLPMWARCAWARGWIQQGSSRQMTEIIVKGFEQEAATNGASLQETVTSFLATAANDTALGGTT